MILGDHAPTQARAIPKKVAIQPELPLLDSPGKVREATWAWITQYCNQAPDYARVIAGYWHDPVFREAAYAMDEIETLGEALMPDAEKIPLMQAQGRLMFARVRALALHTKEGEDL